MLINVCSGFQIYVFHQFPNLHDHTFTPCQILNVDLDDEPIITGVDIKEPDPSQVAVKEEEDSGVC